MPAPSSSSKEAVVAMSSLSPRETELLVLAMQCFKGGEPKLDYAKFSAAAGLANAKGGMDAWCRIRKKLGISGAKKDDEGAESDPAASAPSTPVAKKTPRKRKVKKDIKEEDDKADVKTESDGVDDESPTKKKRTVKTSTEEGI